MYYKVIKIGIENTMNEINNIKNNSDFERVKINLYYNLIAVIHIVGDIYYRISDNKLKELDMDSKNVILAFAYLNNQIKHDRDLELIYYEVQGSMFPINLSKPFHFGKPQIKWADFENHAKNRVAKRDHYDKFLKNRDVYSTLLYLNKVLKIIYEIS